MSIEFRRAVSFGTSNTGLTAFKAWPRLRDGSAAESAITLAVTTNFIEDGKGVYTIVDLTLADNNTRTIKWTKTDGTFLSVSNPDAGAVDSITGSAGTIPTPSDPTLVAGYLDAIDGGGSLRGGSKVEFRIVETDPVTGLVMPRRSWSKTTDSDGRLRADFRPATDYQVRFDEGDWQDFTTPGSGSFQIAGALGAKAP